MNTNLRRLLLASGLTVGVLALSGCTDSARTTIQTSNEATGISVSGHGEVSVKSDTGYFDVGVQVSAATVGEAQSKGAKAADAVIKAVKANGIDDKDIKTTGLSIQPEYSYPRDGGKPTITGYSVTNNVSVKVRKLDTFSKVVDDAATAGGNDVRLNSIRFDVEDNAKAIEQAREAAMADARKKAEQLAKLGDVSLGTPASVQETNSTQPPVAEARLTSGIKAAGAPDSPTPIQPGTGIVVVDIAVRWTIK